MKKIVSEIITNFLVKQGVKEVFLVSGGGNVNLLNSIAKNRKLRYVCNHHEQACSMAAEGYSRVSQNLGVCLVTTGPAGINTLTGVFGAWTDSIPLLVLAGQVKTRDLAEDNMRQLGVQEGKIVQIAKPITKYTAVVKDPLQIVYHLEKAVYLAKSGRPGPVLLDIPSDIQSTVVETTLLKRFDFKNEKLEPKYDPNSKVEKNFSSLLELLQTSQRPLLVVGHGISIAKARNKLFDLIKEINIPIVSSMSGHDLVPTDHRLYVGRHGVFGNRPGNFAVQSADLLITIGARNHLWNIGYNWEAFAPRAKKVVVDIDQSELTKKSMKPNISFHLDAKVFIEKLTLVTSKTKLPKYDKWLKRCQEWKRKYPVVLPEYSKQKKFVNSYYFTESLSKLTRDNEIYFTGVGTSFTGTNQVLNLRKNQRLHYNVGCASMGYGLPAAIGACFANDKKRIVLLAGDGSIMMNLQELQTIKHYNLPIKIFLFNNGGYLAIKNTQNSFFNGQLNAVDDKSGVSFPNFGLIAKAFGIEYKRVTSQSYLDAKIISVLNSPGPALCDLIMDPNQGLFPKVFSQKNPDGSMISKPLEVMYPFLPESELYSALDFSNENKS